MLCLVFLCLSRKPSGSPPTCKARCGPRVPRLVLVAQAPGESAVDVHLHVSTGRGNLVATGMAVQAMTRFLVDVGLLTSKVPAGL